MFLNYETIRKPRDVSGVASFFLSPGRVITMAASNKIMAFKISHKYLLSVRLT